MTWMRIHIGFLFNTMSMHDHTSMTTKDFGPLLARTTTVLLEKRENGVADIVM